MSGEEAGKLGAECKRDRDALIAAEKLPPAAERLLRAALDNHARHMSTTHLVIDQTGGADAERVSALFEKLAAFTSNRAVEAVAGRPS